MRICALGLVVLVLSAFVAIVTGEEVNVEYSPRKPKAGDTIRFYVNTTGDVESTKLWIEECKGNQCFLPKTIDMDEVEAGHFTAEYQLRDDTTSVHYKVTVTFQNGSTTETEMKEFDVDPKAPSNGGTSNDRTPGYGLILAMISIALVIVARRRFVR